MVLKGVIASGNSRSVRTTIRARIGQSACRNDEDAPMIEMFWARKERCDDAQGGRGDAERTVSDAK